MEIKLTEKNKKSINSILLIFTLYIGILTYPLTNLIGNSALLWTSIAVVIFTSIYVNKNINLKFTFIVISFTIFFILNYISVEYKNLVLEEFLNFFRSGILILYLASKELDYKDLIKYWYRIAIISFIVCNLMLSFFVKRNLYMDFGIFMTYNFIIFCTYVYKKYNKKKIFNLILVSICFVEIIIFANRSSILICIFTIAYYEIIKIKKNKIYISILKLFSIFGLSIITFMNLGKVLNSLVYILNNIGVYSYSINKAILSLQNGFIAESSGRDDILSLTMDIAKNSYYMPKGVRYLDYITHGEYLYTHNIFTDILLTFGILGLILFVLYMTYITYKMCVYSRFNCEFKYIASIIYIYTFTRLILSSTLWKESLFWMLIGIVIFYNKDLKGETKKVIV